MQLKDLGLHDYTLKNLMYENNCCKFYDAVDENNTSYVLKFVPSDMTSEGDTFPFVDCFQVKEGVFLVYSSNNFAKEGTDYFTYTGSSEMEVTCNPKHLKRGAKEQQDVKSSTSNESSVANNLSDKKTPNLGPQSSDKFGRETHVGILNVKSNNKNSSKIRSEKFASSIIETRHTPGLASILSKEGTIYPSNANGKHISIVNPSLKIHHSSHKQIVKTPVPKGSFSPVERYSFKGQNLKCYSPRPVDPENPECDFKNTFELRLLKSSVLQRRQSTQNI